MNAHRRKAKEFITDMLVRMFAGALNGLEAVASSDELGKDLSSDPQRCSKRILRALLV